MKDDTFKQMAVKVGIAILTSDKIEFKPPKGNKWKRCTLCNDKDGNSRRLNRHKWRNWQQHKSSRELKYSTYTHG